jgi:Protein of unknown function (DUF2851)
LNSNWFVNKIQLTNAYPFTISQKTPTLAPETIIRTTMKEDFLHYIWRTRRFSPHQPLLTLDGQALQIVQAGEYNTHAGPDFFNARIRIAHTEWAGNVEMHLRASEWYTHQHHLDPAYDSVILHVVWEADQAVTRSDGSPIPTLCLQPYVDGSLVHHYRELLFNAGRQWIPCAEQIGKVPDIVRLNWMDRLLVERLSEKTEYLARQLQATNNNWEEAFYQLLARSFGLQVNAEPFETLARSIPLNTLARHADNPLAIEALLFGQAGLLEGAMQDSYPSRLAKEYHFLQHKYGLQPMQAAQWKYLRLRPANFPTIRIAQFAALLQRSTHLFATVLSAQTTRELEHLLAFQPHEYWNNHYQFDQPSVRRVKASVREFTQLLLINTIIPAVFYYGKTRQLPEYQQKALGWLEALSPEKNSIVDGWKLLGFPARHAHETQALLQLKKHYCDQRHCLSCAMGNAILGR